MIKNICSIILILSTGFNMNTTLIDYFNMVSQIYVYYDNNIIVVDNNNYQDVINSLYDITNNSHEMPAYGVAINDDTIESMKHGLWLELTFQETKIYNDMPFDSLLIEVSPTASGFNLIRKHDGEYEGRCYYLSLNNTMEQLYNTLLDIINKKSQLN